MRKRILALVVLVCLVGGGIWLWHSSTSQKHPALPVGKPAILHFDHILVILEENHALSHVIGNPDAPYINKLARKYALATNYWATAHPSLPNYLQLTSGTNADIFDDCNPPGSSCHAKVKNIADTIEQSGRTWKTYQENMPAPCTAYNVRPYVTKHNPFVYYDDILHNAVRCKGHVVPFTQFGKDITSADSLPNYAFITPNICNDMHDCSVKTGDDWLAQNVPTILGSHYFTAQNSLLVIVWDESELKVKDNKVPAIFIGAHIKKGHTATAHYDHYALLHTIETAWGLPALTGNDKAAPVMKDLFE